MSKNPGAIFKPIQDLLPDFCASATEELIFTDDKYHRLPDAWSQRSTCSPEGQLEHIELNALNSKNLCPRCMNFANTTSSFDLNKLEKLIWSTFELVDTLRMVSKSSASTTQALGHNVMMLELTRSLFMRSYDEIFSKASSAPATTTREVEATEALKMKVDEALKTTNAKLRSPEVREKLKGQLRQKLKPNHNADFLFDESPTLIAIVNYNANRDTSPIKAMVEQFAVRRDEHVVLLVPRFMSDYAATYTQGYKDGLQPSASAHDLSPEEIETAAFLWDPSGTGPYHSLYAAVQAARSI